VANIQGALDGSLRAALLSVGIEPPETIVLERPARREHGDWSSNVALATAKAAGRNPRELATQLAETLNAAPPPHVTKVEVAGPGFVNFHLAPTWLHDVLRTVVTDGEKDYARSAVGAGERVQVEFVSANPTGPLHVGHGRGAVVGDALARLLETAGYRVEREYYVNDAGGQAELFGASLEARFLQHFGHEAEIPERGYQGRYLAELAEEIAAETGDSMLALPAQERRARLGHEGMRRELEAIGASLERMNVRIDTWFRETTLRAEGRIEQAVQLLKDRELAYEEDGAVWFRSTRFGDEKDRVLVRSSGEPTYFAADCAYLREKFARGFDRLIYVWGADHHGTMKRLVGAAQAFGYEVDRVEFILYQLVNLYRGGELVRMSKRTGDIITLDEVLDEVGPDAARYTLLTRSTDTTLDFDIDLVKSQTLENPVYYVQYAHARIASILRYAAEHGVAMEPFEKVRVEELVHETELDLLRKIAELPEQVRFAAEARAPYRLTKYAEELAADFHRFYTECRVVTDDAELTQARLHLAAATRQVIANVLAILGVSAPDSMERLGEGL